MRQFSTLDSMWRYTCMELIERDPTMSRNGACREITGYHAVVSEPRGWVVSRRPSPTYAAGELLWYLSGSADGDHIVHYAPQYRNFLVPDASGKLKAPGAYGERWASQWQPVIDALRADCSTRQAVLATFRSGDLTSCGPDKPCTLTLQLLIRNNAMDMIATMRSNDAWLGMPYDTWCFTRIQMLLAAELGVDVGTYTHQVGSMHLYERDLAKVTAKLDQPQPPSHTDTMQHSAAPGVLMHHMRDAAAIEFGARYAKPTTQAQRDELFEHVASDAANELSGSLLQAVVMLAAMRCCGMRSVNHRFEPMWDGKTVEPHWCDVKEAVE